jgi:PAS domain S-box-containing protein
MEAMRETDRRWGRLYRNHVQGAWVRSGASLFLCSFAFIAYKVKLISYFSLLGVIGSVAFLILINPPFLWGLKKIRRKGRLKLYSFCLNLAEILAYSAVIYFCGGIYAPYLAIIYGALIAFVGTLAPRRYSFLMAGTCLFAFSLMTFLQLREVLPTLEPHSNSPLTVSQQLFYLGVVWGLILVLAFITDYTADIIRKQRERLREQNRLLEIRVAEQTAELVDEIEERKHKDQALKESEEKYRMLIENAGEAVIIAREGRLVFVNPKTTQVFGYTLEKMLSRPFVDFIYPEDGDLVLRNHFRRVKGEKVPNAYSFRIVTGAGETRWVQINSVWIHWETGPATLSFLRDITNRRRMERELLKAEKLESLGVLAGGIAHDFNNILLAILGNISLAKRVAGANPKLMERLEQAEKASLRAKDLTAQLLTFSRGGDPVKTTASLNEMIKETAGFALRGSKTKGEFQFDNDLWPVEIDIGQMSQVIHNLVLNANQAMPEGGAIRVVAQNIRLGQAPALKIGKFVKISIQDEGLGIPPDIVHRIFDPYFTTKPKGTGLGLATVHSIIKRHGGEIRVDSQVGKGSVFSIYLPASDKEVLSFQKEEDASFLPKGRVLVMDDEEALRDVFGMMLDLLGFRVEPAKDGQEAIRKFFQAGKSGDPFQLVILDLTIAGGMGGKETLTRLREIDSGIKAIACSGYSQDTSQIEFRSCGCDVFLPKPFQIEDLTRALHEVFRKRIDSPADKNKVPPSAVRSDLPAWSPAVHPERSRFDHPYGLIARGLLKSSLR